MINEAKTDEDCVVLNWTGLVEKVKGVDSVIGAAGRVQHEVGVPELEKMGFPFRFIGDRAVLRKAFGAIHEGFLVGMEI